MAWWWGHVVLDIMVFKWLVMWVSGDQVSFTALTARPAHLAQCSEVLIVRCGEGGSEEGGLWSETRAQWEAPSEMSDWPSCTFQLYSVQLQDLSGRYEPCWPGIYTLLSCTDNQSSLDSACMRSIRIIWISSDVVPGVLITPLHGLSQDWLPCLGRVSHVWCLGGGGGRTRKCLHLSVICSPAHILCPGLKITQQLIQIWQFISMSKYSIESIVAVQLNWHNNAILNLNCECNFC